MTKCLTSLVLFLTFQLFTEHCEENSEVYRTRRFFEHLVDLFLLHIQTSCGSHMNLTNTYSVTKEASFSDGERWLTQSSKRVPQIVFIDEAVSVLVHDGKGLWTNEYKDLILQLHFYVLSPPVCKKTTHNILTIPISTWGALFLEMPHCHIFIICESQGFNTGIQGSPSSLSAA